MTTGCVPVTIHPASVKPLSLFHGRSYDGASVTGPVAGLVGARAAVGAVAPMHARAVAHAVPRGGAAVRAPVEKTAAQRLRPIRPPARPVNARPSLGWLAASSLGQPRAGLFWLAGNTGLVFDKAEHSIVFD